MYTIFTPDGDRKPSRGHGLQQPEQIFASREKTERRETTPLDVNVWSARSRLRNNSALPD